jgi:hypothetical protein
MTSQRRLASIAAAVFVASGGAFAAGQLDALSDAAGGADTPEAAVDAMFQSLGENDILGVLDQLAPGEREVLRDATVDYVEELTRLGVLSEGLDLEGVPGFEFSSADVTYDVQQANDRVWLVGITGGELTLGANIAELPLGEMLFERLDLESVEAPETITVDLAEAVAADEPPTVAVIEEDGQYYVSTFYTVAELAASEAGFDMPATPVQPAGAASAEEALRGMIDAGLELDVAGLIGLTPPDEMAALYDYGQILVDLADEAIAEEGIDAQLAQLEISIDTLEFEEVPVTGGTKLLPVRIGVSGVTPEGQDFAASVAKVDDTCVEYEFSVSELSDAGGTQEGTVSGSYCAGDIRQVFEGSDVPPEVQQIAERAVAQLGQVGVVATEVDGQWYVSPTRSFSDLLLVALQGLEAGDIETLIDFAEASSGVEVEDVLEGDSEILDDVVTGGVVIETVPPKGT